MTLHILDYNEVKSLFTYKEWAASHMSGNSPIILDKNHVVSF